MTPHINAAKEDIADIVLMPGDPYRAKWAAENFLTKPRLVELTSNFTRENSLRTISTLSSDEALSTTITSQSSESGSSKIDPKHSRNKPLVFQFTIQIVKNGRII